MIDDEMSSYPCKKHSISTNLFFSNDLERRYYFEKPTKCNLHSKNLAKSLNELYTEPAPNFSSFELPQEFPLTRSVSTTTEIYSSHGNTAATSINQLQQSQTLSHTNVSGKELKNRKNQTVTTKKDLKDDVSQNRGTKGVCSDEKKVASANTSNIHDICGLSRGIRKTKDELFNEFCKKAGSRPKPKDIYYIDDTGEHEDEENIYIVDGNFMQQHQQLQNQNQHYQNQLNQLPTSTVQQLRRNSMFVEPPSVVMLKRNSNLSLHTTDANGGFIEKAYPKGHFELSRCDSEIWNNYPDQFHNKNGILQDCNVYNSRTLPRSFMKRSSDSQEFLGRNACGTYPGNRFGQGSRETIYHSGLALHKSCENVNSLNFTTNQSLGHRKTGNPSALLALPSKLQSSSQTVQWPAAIPTSPSNFSTKSIRFNSNTNGIGACNTGAGRIAAGHGNRGVVSVIGNIPPSHHKFQRAYAFDDRKTDATFESFDLDEMERERRKSHANLFDGSKGGSGLGGFYDMINGTAV